ncbi:MAG: ribonuclease J, partial [Polyangiales bacterium]
EDHIGAIPYLLRRLDVPVFAPPYALALIKARLAEHAERPDAPAWLRRPRLHATTAKRAFSMPSARASASPIEIEPIEVTHSIVDAMALAIRTVDGTIVHTGDFKIDDGIGEVASFDRARLAEIGREGVRLLLSDSTNVDNAGRTLSEAVVAATLDEVIGAAKGRVIVSLFASNVLRLRALASTARRHRRRIALIGRSMQLHARVARELDFLDLPPDLVVTLEDAARLPGRDVMVLATGSQAEPAAALARLSIDDHPRFRLDPGDTVILSSRAIPGKERNIAEMIGALYRRGCLVRFLATDPTIHASGHACRDEQREMIELVEPARFIPVHGTRHHLERHAALARELGVASVAVIENGEVATVVADGLARDGTAPTGKVRVDEAGVLSAAVLRERSLAGELGLVLVTVFVDDAGRTVERSLVSLHGVDDAPSLATDLTRATAEIDSALDRHAWSTSAPTDAEIAELARGAARRALDRNVGRRPMAVAHVVRAKRTGAH